MHRIGRTYSPKSGNEVKKDTVSDVLNYFKTFADGEKLLLLSPIHLEEGQRNGRQIKSSKTARVFKNKSQGRCHQN